MTYTVAAAVLLSLTLGSAALAGPDLKPAFSAKTGTVKVVNMGDADAAVTWVTVSCTAAGGGACPDPAPADAAPYLNAAFPDKVAIEVSALAPGKTFAHTIAFFDSLVFAPGNYAFQVCADAGNALDEDHERNNCIVVKKSVRGALQGATGLKGNTASY